jgi:hypothetical protein
LEVTEGHSQGIDAQGVDVNGWLNPQLDQHGTLLLTEGHEYDTFQLT